MKKCVLLLVLVLFYSHYSYSQSGCGTPDISETDYLALPWYGNETFLNDFYDSLENAMSGPAQRNLQDADIMDSGKTHVKCGV